MSQFAGRVALVTGSGSGIGRAAAHRLAAESATVVSTVVSTVVAAADGGGAAIATLVVINCRSARQYWSPLRGKR